MWESIRAELEAELGEPITIDGLTGNWKIAQRAAGHRHSVDDVLTADFAAELCPDAGSVLDLGTGIGTVALLVLWRLGGVRELVVVEAQDVSFRLLRANLTGNGLTGRVEAIHGDLRTIGIDRRFELVTGSPPYFPVGTGVMPADSQKAHARFELRGDVADYVVTARAHVAEHGWFVFCFPTPQRDRALAAITSGHMHLARMRDVVPRAGRTPLFTLFAARPHPCVPILDPPFPVRDADGALTAAMQSVRTRSGF